MRPPRSRRAPQVPGGFSFVELVVVMVLLGVLSAVAFARLGSGDAFEEAGVENLLLAEARLARQTAMSRVDATVALQITRTGGQLDLMVLVNGAPAHSTEVAAGQTTVVVSAGVVGGAVVAGVPLTITYDGLGNTSAVVLGSTAGTVASGIKLNVSGTGGGDLCLSPVGFAHRGDCA